MRLKDDTDFNIIKRTLDGETSAFNLLVKTYYQQMYRVSYRITLNREDAEDATQQAFLKSYTNLGKFKMKSSFSTWLYRITCNIAITISKNRNRHLADLDDTILAVTHSGLNIIESGEDIRAVRSAIEKLPKKQRLAVILRTYEQLPYKKIAEILKCSVGAVKANYFHALSKLRKNLDPYIKDGKSV